MRWLSLPFMCVNCCCILVAAATARGEEDSPAAWRLHKIDPENINGAAAVVDVNRDGRLDIIAGKFWYESPDWKKHFVRDVEIIRGRNDDYSSLPLDVNADGWTDIVSVNYRSKSLYWVEHPGESLAGPWKKHVIDTPGPSETGRLADVDGDGQMDVAPNGTDFAAWYSLSIEQGKPTWLRHELPKELIGHGIGFGDMNADARGDIVGPSGWAEAPENRRTGRWIWHADFQLDRDAGIPILVDDVDGDGDADLVWGRGHDYGLYWLENKEASGERKLPDSAPRAWKRHTIDETWSQAHSLLLADINNDGHDDLIAGKRYFGHDGKDPGANDPMVIYWYSFDADERAWQRHRIHESKTVAFGLDPKAADIDADGDVDILCADRSGLYLLENLLAEKGAASALPAYDDHTNLSVLIDADGKPRPVKTPADWDIRRGHILQGMQRVMGPLPQRDRELPLDMRVLKTEDADGYTRHIIRYRAEPGDLDPGNLVPALLLVPKDNDGAAPAMLCLHPTSPLGKAQIAGLDGHSTRFYAHELAQRGYVCLVPDYPSFGEYRDYNFANDAYTSGTMKAIVDNIRGVDLLTSLEYVDGDRIGVIGHSLGGHNALFTAAFDERIGAVVTSCGFTAFGDYYGGDLKGWTSDRYMPAIRDDFAGDPRRVPFDFPEVLGAIAPRPTFISAPLHDDNFDVGGVKKCVAAAGEIYALHQSRKNLHAVYPDCGHDFPDEIRAAVYDWLDVQLKP